MSNALTESVTLANGTKMPLLGLGTWQSAEGQTVKQAVRWAIEAGYRHIDTAAIYQNERGVGEAVRESGIARGELFITTKAWNDAQRAGKDAVRRAFDDSLAKLNMDYVDLYLVHWPVKGRYIETWQVMEEIYASGRARAIGVSNFMVHHLKDLLPHCKIKPMVNQIEFHPWLMNKDLMALDQREGIVHEAWSPLMQGKITTIPALQAIAKRVGKTVAQVTLRWMVQHGVVTIPKSVRRERIVENAGIFDFVLSAADMAAIDALDQNKRIGADPDNFSF